MNRAQSETIGFVLVFSMIVASTGLVYVVGFSSLDDVRTAEELENMERAFDVLDHNVRDLPRRGATTRATEVSLGRGDLVLGNATTITVSATNTSDPTDNLTITVETRPIVYRTDDTAIVYVSGSVIRSEPNAAIMRSEPGWIVGSRRTIIPLLVSSAGRGGTSIGGDVTVLVRTGLNSRGVASFTTGPASAATVNVTVESPRADAWQPLLDDRGFTAVDGDASDGNVTYTRQTEEVHFQLITFDVEFDR